MRIRTLIRYLIGNRAAILEIAANPRALGLGGLFVLSAGFAREYDGEDLLHAPWHLLLPLGASLVTSFVLFALTFAKVITARGTRPPLFAAYRSFLALFWLTAPLAWLYAVPYERFLAPPEAVRANLLTLGAVALWRVALMVRVVSVLMGYRVWDAFFRVMLFADVVAFLAIRLMPLPVVSIMGGVRLTDSEWIIHSTTCCLTVLSILSLPLWGFGALDAWISSKPVWQSQPPQDQPSAPGRRAWGLAAASLAVWVLVLPLIQPAQQRRYRVERLLRNGQIADALAFMSELSPADFPPHWDPPPRPGYGERASALFDVLEVIAVRPPAAWVERLFKDKLRQYLGDPYAVRFMPDEEARRLIQVLLILPNGPILAAEHREALLLGMQSELSPQDRKNLEELLLADPQRHDHRAPASEPPRSP